MVLARWAVDRQRRERAAWSPREAHGMVHALVSEHMQVAVLAHACVLPHETQLR